MATKHFEFTFSEATPGADAVARWMACVAIAWNDIVFLHDLYLQNDEGGRGIYLVRVAAGHLSELLSPDGPFRAGYDDWPEVQGRIATLNDQARGDFEHLRRIAADQSETGSFGWQLDRMRNGVFHYPNLHAGQSNGTRLEITRMLYAKADEEGSITIADGSVAGVRLGFADEISVSIALGRAQIGADSDALRTFTVQLVDAQTRFIRFGEIVVDAYLRSLPEGVLKEVQLEG